ncbi:MAG: ATP-binding cassette domain-containing protein [Opitutae bacterium]|nr:ATP-binding cassette domain-containing protein [Opitutae bacterium]
MKSDPGESTPRPAKPSREGGAAIETENLWAGYGKKMVLPGLNLRINKGDFVGLIGPNGSGKSTLMHCLTGIMVPTKGTVRWGHRPLSAYSRKALAREFAVVESEEKPAFPFSVAELVEMGRFPYLKRFQGFAKADRQAVRWALRATRLTGYEDRTLQQLSSGERQRVFLARALAQETRALFLDEPTSHLDVKYQIESFHLLKRLNEEDGKTIVCISHDINLTLQFCPRLILLKEGRILADGSPGQPGLKRHLDAAFEEDFILRKHPQSGRPYIVYPAKDR